MSQIASIPQMAAAAGPSLRQRHGTAASVSRSVGGIDATTTAADGHSERARPGLPHAHDMLRRANLVLYPGMAAFRTNANANGALFPQPVKHR